VQILSNKNLILCLPLTKQRFCYSLPDMADSDKKPKYVRLPLHPSIYEGIESHKEATKDKGDQRSVPDRRFPMEYLKPQGESRTFVRALARDSALGNWINKLPAACKLQSTESADLQCFVFKHCPLSSVCRPR
jgi:hypothetical protein